ncbi:hypothetical protein ACIPSE_42900 [Streptomyces sp. NPDC090106]|uniref:hypothetical protein n=1 Tax=Streptomyces sp. NPDC090106 TaxID=3365946 RepID=UPI003820E791
MGPTGRTPIGDRHWLSGAHLAATCALVFASAALLVDWNAGTLTTTRALLWLTLSAVLCAVLLPLRVTAGPGWLAVDGLVTHHRVHTDALVAVHLSGTVSTHLLLRDTDGNRLRLDLHVLLANPLLWHELDTGARHSLADGTLDQGTDVLRELRHEIDDETALSVLKASGIS